MMLCYKMRYARELEQCDNRIIHAIITRMIIKNGATMFGLKLKKERLRRKRKQDLHRPGTRSIYPVVNHYLNIGSVDALLEGAGSVWDPAPNLQITPSNLTPQQQDALAIFYDWLAVGNDMRAATKQLGQEHKISDSNQLSDVDQTA